MTVKNRTFPLHLSSLEVKREAKKAPGLQIATPQTATQNVQAKVVSPLSRLRERGGGEGSGTKRNAVVTQPTSTQPSPTSGRGGKCNSFATSSAALKYESPRRAMVANLVKLGIKDEAVLNAMGTVPRHQFIEPGLVGQAYINASLPIGHQQTISQPYIVAKMIEVMRNGKKLNSVLEIGTGCGYQAAVLAQVCDNVYSIERIKALHELGKKNLRALCIPNLRLHFGDGMLGLPQVAPFEGIILAAAGIQIPDALLNQLAIGGRLVGPVVASGGEQKQVLQLIERTGPAEWTSSVLEECYFVPLCPGTI